MRVDRRSFVRRTAWAGVSALGLCGAKNPGGVQAAPSEHPLRVRIWCEGTARKAIYPEDIDGALAGYLQHQPGLQVVRARLNDPAAGLDDEALDATDVLVWWGRLRHDDVPPERVAAVIERVKEGRLGFLALHASCSSQPFKALMGTSCEPARWREDGRPEHVTVQDPAHPIAHGVASFTIPKTDMFAEPFSVPKPESVVLISTWDQGETLRSGLTWTVGKGRVAYLRPGHDAFPVLVHPSVRKLVANAVHWAGRRS